jgi:hypothetical protein
VLFVGQDPEERRKALAGFNAGGAVALVATDVASQGLNLQARARWVVNLELPWNPLRREQRAGRVDRSGQSRRAHVTLVVARHDAEGGLLSHLARRVLTARRALGADVLEATLPGETAVAAALFGETPAPGLAAPRAMPAPCAERRWARAARSAARDLVWRRQLVTAWPAEPPFSVAARAGWSKLPRLRLAAGAPALLVFVVSVTGPRGAVVERHVVAARCAGLDTNGRVTPVHLEAARDAAATVVVARVNRLMRRRPAQLIRARRADASLLRHLRRVAGAAERQPGLLDRRSERAAGPTLRRHDDLSREMRDVPSADEAGLLEVQHPVLVLVLGER